MAEDARLEDPAEGLAPRLQSTLRAPRAAGVAGILFAALFIASLLVAGSPGKRFVEQWSEGGIRTALLIVGLYLIPLAGVAFLWFIGVVRDRIGHAEDQLFSTVFLGSGLLFVAMLFTAAATASGLALITDVTGSTAPPSTEVLAFAQALTYAFLYVYAARTAGVFMLVTSTIVMRVRFVPRWIAIAGYLIALLLLVSVRNFQQIIMLFPLWVALLSTYILVRPHPGHVGRPGHAKPGGA